MNIVIIYNDAYPHGRACTNRIHFYARGLIESGHQTRVLVHRPTEPAEKIKRNIGVKGYYESVPFEYTSGRTGRSANFIGRRVHDIRGIYAAGIKLLKNRNKTDAVIFVSGGITQILFYRIITWLSGILLIQEKSELPFIYSNNSFPKIIYQWFYIRYMFRFFDGIIVITKKLQKYFENKISSNTRLVHIPILINNREFDTEVNHINDDQFNIMYAGSLCQKKDGIISLLRSFNKTIKDGYKAHLFIIGDTHNIADKNNIHFLISRFNLQKYVTITGYLPRNEFNYLLNRARLLVLAKPKSKEAEYCFPSKLAEYLLTGKPVLTTRLGEIPVYLKDGENAYLVEPDNIYQFAEKIEYIMDHSDEAMKVGRKGRILAAREFDFKRNTVLLANFIQSLVTEKFPEEKRKTLGLVSE